MVDNRNITTRKNTQIIKKQTCTKAKPEYNECMYKNDISFKFQ